MNDFLLYAGLPTGVLAIGAAALFLSPYGPAVATLLANSKVARIVVAAAGAVLAGGLVVLKAFNAGKAHAREDVEKENRHAVETKRRIRQDVDRTSDDDLRRELEGWSKR